MIREERWPALPLAEWKDTYATLHMWTQVVGKVRLALSPNINHWWGTAFYVTARGLTTSAMPYEKGICEVHFDFVSHALEIETSLGESRTFRLAPRTVAAFYEEFMDALRSLGIHVKVWEMPVEIPRPVRFRVDESHRSYDSEYAHCLLLLLQPALRQFLRCFQRIRCLHLHVRLHAGELDGEHRMTVFDHHLVTREVHLQAAGEDPDLLLRVLLRADDRRHLPAVQQPHHIHQ